MYIHCNLFQQACVGNSILCRPWTWVGVTKCFCNVSTALCIEIMPIEGFQSVMSRTPSPGSILSQLYIEAVHPCRNLLTSQYGNVCDWTSSEGRAEERDEIKFMATHELFTGC